MNLKPISLSQLCTLCAFSICVSVVFGAGAFFKPAAQDVHGSETATLITSTTEPLSDLVAADPPPSAQEVTIAEPVAERSDSVSSQLIADMIAVPQQIGTTATAADPVAVLAEPVQQQATFVGVWAADVSSCSVQSFRDGLLPTVITREGASAGDTFCSFKNQQQTSSGWRMDAVCSSRQEHWSTRVHLSMTGDRLIWRSKRGAQAYTRCMNDMRVAQAH